MRFFKVKARVLYAVDMGGTPLSPTYAFTVLKVKGQQLTLLSHHVLTQWEAVCDLLPDEGTILWLINDEAVLCKAKLKQPVTSLFPNFDRASFYISETDQTVSICRKTHWYAWKDKIEGANKSIARLAIGVNCFEYFKDVLPTSFQAGEHEFMVEDKQLVSLQRTSVESAQLIDLGESTIAATAFMGFAMAVDYLSRNSLKHSALLMNLIQQKPQELPPPEAQLDHHQYYLEQQFLNRFFEKQFLALHGVVVCVVLLLGCLLFIWSESSRQQFNSLSQQQQMLRLKVQQKEALLSAERTKWQQIERKAQHQRIPLLDQLFQAMPKGIQLKKATLSTLDHNADELIIWGGLSEKHTLTQWVDAIRLHQKVKQVFIAQLTTDKAVQLHFELHILLHDEHQE